MLSVSPIAFNIAIELRMERGIDMVMISVDRQLPKKRRIIKLVKAAAIKPYSATPAIAAFTKID